MTNHARSAVRRMAGSANIVAEMPAAPMSAHRERSISSVRASRQGPFTRNPQMVQERHWPEDEDEAGPCQAGNRHIPTVDDHFPQADGGCSQNGRGGISVTLFSQLERKVDVPIRMMCDSEPLGEIKLDAFAPGFRCLENASCLRRDGSKPMSASSVKCRAVGLGPSQRRKAVDAESVLVLLVAKKPLRAFP